MKRPNRDAHKETLTQTDYIWYSKSLEKYIDFLESNQKEFVEWLEGEKKKLQKQAVKNLPTGTFRKQGRALMINEALTKYKELNKNNE